MPSSEQNLGPSEGNNLSHSVQRAGLQAEENVPSREIWKLQVASHTRSNLLVLDTGLGQSLHSMPFILAAALKVEPDVSKDRHIREPGI